MNYVELAGVSSYSPFALGGIAGAPTSTPEPTPVPTDLPTAVPTELPTDVPTNTPEPTAVPTELPTDVPTNTPEPTAVPTNSVTNTPEPTNTPLPTQTVAPTNTPTTAPTNTPKPTKTPKPEADLSIVESAVMNANKTQVTFTLVVSNAGPQAATNVIVKDNLPNKLDYVSAAATDGNCALSNVDTVECELGTIDYDESVTITIVTNIAKNKGVVTNTARVDGQEPDPNKANNKSSINIDLQTGQISQNSNGMEQFTVRWMSQATTQEGI